MRIGWDRAIISSVLSLGCVTLGLTAGGAASGSTTAPDAAPSLTWSQPMPTGATSEEDIKSVSCPTRKFCAAVDSFG